MSDTPVESVLGVNCLHEDTLLEFVSGQMTAPLAAAVHEHLDGCIACRQLVAQTVKAMALDASSPEPDEPDENPRRIGRFEIEEVLGAGGMGLVYRARDPLLRRMVAVKLVGSRSRSAAEGDTPDRDLLAEAQALASLGHPNVVTIFEVGTAAHGIFMAFELVEGDSVRQWLDVPRSWRAILDVFLQAGRGLQAAHEANVVHGDFKPDNVLVGRDGRVRVADFGLAIAGTPLYLAPERLLGEAATRGSDQYAFCLSMYEALLGARPFESTGTDQREAALAGRFRAPGPTFKAPRWLLRALRRGMRVAPEKRFPSMAALLGHLEQSSARSRRLRRWALVTLAASLVGGIGVVTAGKFAHETPRPKSAIPFEGPPRFMWSELASTDVNASKRFYARLFGWRMQESVHPTLGLYTTLLNGTGTVAGMYELTDPQRKRGSVASWFSYVAVHDLDASVSDGKRAGALLVRGPYEARGSGRFVILRDSSGAFVGALKPIGFNGASAQPNSPGSVVWRELETPADTEATRFYSAWLGWKDLGNSIASPPSPAQNVTPLAASVRKSETPAAAWVVYFGALDCEATVARARDLGATVVVPTQNVGTSGCRAELRDPQGVPFGIAAAGSAPR